MKPRGNVHIGTSGWHSDHWKGPFYPERLPASEMFSHYSRQFKAVEVNTSFYRLPEKKTLQDWRNTAPESFVFAVKASRYITHMKKLKDPHEPVATLVKNITVLGAKLGPILFQLPPRWKVNPACLRDFLTSLPAGFRYAFEFRDPSFFDNDQNGYAARDALRLQKMMKC